MTSVRPVLMCLLLGITSLAVGQDSVRFSGSVQVDGSERFTMETTIRKQDGLVKRTVDFYAGKERIMNVVSEFSSSPLKMRSVKLEDFRTGRQEFIEQQGQQYRLRSKKNAREDMEEGTIEEDEDEPLLSSYMIGEFIVQNLARLRANEELEFELAVPSRLEQIGFDLELTGEKDCAGEACYEITMSASSWIIRQLVDPIMFYFQKAAPHRLLQYKGRLSPTDDNGDDLDGAIIYNYE